LGESTPTFWSNEAYVVGIVPVVRPAYSLKVYKEGMEKEQEGRGLLVEFSISRENMACYPNRRF
jgi:hypothetical protein